MAVSPHVMSINQLLGIRKPSASKPGVVECFLVTEAFFGDVIAG